MEITEVRIKLMEDSDDRLQAFCSITFDNCFVIRDLKIIEGVNGAFVAMPSRKLTSHCSDCGHKNHLRAPFCNHCGAKLREERLTRDADGRTKLYADIAHPINSECREMIQERVIREFELELQRADQPGYASRYDDDYGDAGEEIDETPETPPRRTKVEPAAAEPRAPHKPPKTERQPQPAAEAPAPTEEEPAAPPPAPEEDDDFGAGIF